MISRRAYKHFYDSVDRETLYSIENSTEAHPFFPSLSAFIEKWGLREKKCLEIGSAKGLFQDTVEDYTGIDIAETLARHYHKSFYCASDAHLPFPDSSFDAIFTYATHEHIPDIENALEEIIRVLKPGGVCLFAPAWHTRSWFAQGLAVRPYADLTFSERFKKLGIPFRDFFLVRWSFVFFRRALRLLLYLKSPHKIPLRYRKLKANYEIFWQSDSDACNSLDPFDVILWLRSRGIFCSHYQSLLRTILVRTFNLEFQKPPTRSVTQ